MNEEEMQMKRYMIFSALAMALMLLAACGNKQAEETQEPSLLEQQLEQQHSKLLLMIYPRYISSACKICVSIQMV